MKSAICGIVVFDLGNRESFNNVKKWLDLFAENKQHNAICVVMGNKADLTKEVETEEAASFCSEHGVDYFEVSAKENKNI